MTSRIRLDYLSTFVDVVDKGSLLASAESTGSSVSTVSTQIDAVESYFNTRLLKRDASGVKPTREGRIVYNSSKDVLRGVEETRRLLNSLDQQHLDVASGCFGIPILAELKNEYKKSHPELDLTIELHGTRACFKLLNEGEVSLIFAGYIPKEISAENYFIAELGKDRLVFITPPDHALSSKDQVTLKDIKKTPLVMIKEEEDMAKRVKVELAKHNITRANLVKGGVMDSIFAQIYGVVSGFGCAITSYIHARKFADAGLITIKDVDEFTDERTVLLICSKKSLDNPDVKRFVDFAMKLWDHSSDR